MQNTLYPKGVPGKIEQKVALNAGKGCGVGATRRRRRAPPGPGRAPEPATAPTHRMDRSGGRMILTRTRCACTAPRSLQNGCANVAPNRPSPVD
ncbi:MAG: hypothetical protein V2J55_22890 [Candidatus Competibacteraceae bacterium]|nr:hypothetical protein [Candidatus Competibacteraceae bacterium]